MAMMVIKLRGEKINKEMTAKELSEYKPAKKAKTKKGKK